MSGPLAQVAAAAVMAVSAGHTEVPEKPAPEPCRSRECRERVARKQCSQTRPVACIHRAALHWRVDFAMLLRKARCESRLNPYAANSAHAGLYQFRVARPSTWATTRYATHSPYSAKYSSLAAGQLHAQGRGREWACR